VLTDQDIYLFREGTHSHLHSKLGCRLLEPGAGANFAVWAPNAAAVSVTGDWNGWTAGDPLVPRAMFGVLNTLLFFPSGAISPVAQFPHWLRWIAIVDPFTYAIHGFKSILLKDGGFVSIETDLACLFLFGFGTLFIATPLFKRTL